MDSAQIKKQSIVETSKEIPPSNPTIHPTTEINPYNPKPEIDGLCVNIGSGVDYKKGYINIDKFDTSADMQCDVSKMPFNNNTIAQITMHEVVEHLSMDELLPALREIHRVLKPNGRLVGTCPDIIDACKHVVDNPEDDYSLATIYGNQASGGQFHKMGFTPKRLFKYFGWAGFRVIKSAYFKTSDTSTARQSIYFEAVK